MPKYYVNFGNEYKQIFQAKNPQDACLKTLRKYLEKDAQESVYGSETNTLTVPEKFRVSERGFPQWNHVNNDDYHEFSHQQISKLLNNGNNGGEIAHA